mmetsp:Transcript_18392/g.37636  ORF Transcript_18392/g.37636 Transcript_18392/m.37636 type:complete len:105 (-) Transcript_18392:541-855(-)|eukprot:CAMPEP_0201118382 /NCGR_PEP_ID=MMETSP0850-20130426/2557_1 /ASSEMBLY_ACC=CAM_ASM_000622 /TAXON_ID=183588 /ORGANISM="Pseudo-nitzschia fraudulenta, Strain WWA7" /LENGTH=104 /DNA_ID=CAMNT_0047383551 /DNA_START=74 /DNA_END=388 /DNA_ORIENTATION=+
MPSNYGSTVSFDGSDDDSFDFQSDIESLPDNDYSSGKNIRDRDSGIDMRRHPYPPARAFEGCRRHTIFAVLVLTFVVILFGVTSIETHYAPTICKQLLVIVTGR